MLKLFSKLPRGELCGVQDRNNNVEEDKPMLGQLEFCSQEMKEQNFLVFYYIIRCINLRRVVEHGACRALPSSTTNQLHGPHTHHSSIQCQNASKWKKTKQII